MNGDIKLGLHDLLSFLHSEGEMAWRIADFAWDSHPLGPVEQWPQSLKTAVSLILNSRQPMWIGWGPQMWFLYNDAYLHVLGLSKHPWALGRPASEVWAEIWDVCGPLADKVFRAAEASFVDDVRLFMSRGDFVEETFYSFSYSPIRDEFGAVAGLFCPSNDVTPKVIGARRLRTLSELAANALVQKSIEAACRSAAATLARNPDDVPFGALYLVKDQHCVLQESIGALGDRDGLLSPSIALHESHRGISRAIVGALHSGRTQPFLLDDGESSSRAADRRVVDVLVLPVASRADSRALGVFVAGLNPTRPLDEEHTAFFELVASNIGTAIQNAQASEEEKKRADMLAETDRAKTAFFSNVSHEFRTPLTLMLGPLDEISKGTDERDRSLAQTARRNALRLLKLVNTLLEFSRLEAGRNDALFVETDLASLTRDVASSFRSAIESAGLRFLVEMQLDEFAFVDRSMWERIILNLLSNALKFTFEGQIAISLRRAGNAAELTVSDTGVGIPAAELPHLFERFHRVRGATGRSHEGSGIGLALVRDLVNVHGGTVDVRSTEGVGTTLCISLPLGNAHLDASQIAPEAPATYASAIEQYLADIEATASRAGNVRTNAQLMGRPRVLLADDNADLRDYVSEILSSRFDVVAVTNGREAIALAQRESFHLILSDVMMPEMDGFELLEAVRADDRIASVPFIMLSARAGEESAVEGLLRGADEYIPKPFSAEELIARVYAQISTARLRERATEELRASEERFRTLAASLPYIVFEADVEGSVTFLSDEYTAYTGLPVEQGYASRWNEAIHADDLETVGQQWRWSLSTGEPHVADFRLRRRDGVYRWFTGRGLPQRDPEGTIYRWIGTVVDVHDQRQAARERDLLARASEVLAEPFDLQNTLRAIASFTVPELADWCQIDLRLDDGRIKTVAAAHREPEKDLSAQQFVGKIHLNPEGQHGSPYVIRTGKSQLLERVPDAVIDPAIGDEEESRVYRDLGMHSIVAVPLVAEGKTLGMLAVIYGTSKRQYSIDDVPMFEELGRRAGLAIQRAEVYEREHRAAESFQEASLPKLLPRTPRLSLDAFYAPGRAEAQVGGDWYDALRLVDGRVVLSIGDVAGSGLDAAVTMGNMRQIIRGIAQVHADPALMLNAADRALRLEHPDTFVTAFVGVFDAITDTLTYASAGHPPPLLRRPDGTVDALTDTGLPLGLRANDDTTRSKTIQLTVDSSLVLYTDGLTEFDRAPEQGEVHLREIVADVLSRDEPNPARRIVELMTHEALVRDDVAVLVANVCATPQNDAGDGASLQRWSFDTEDSVAAGAARAGFAEAFARHSGSEEDVALAELVFGELVSNTVRYAPGLVETIVDWSGPEPVLHVLDNGPGFRHISILPPDLLSESGRGLFIVSALTHDFRVSKRSGGGSHARAVLRLRRRQLIDAGVEIASGSLLNALDSSLAGLL